MSKQIKIICSDCNKPFSCERSLLRHNNIKKGSCGDIYKCGDCGKVFKYKSKLQEHKGRKTSCKLIIGDPTDIKKEKNQCHFCYRKYSTRYSLKKHIEICKVKNTEEGMQVLNEVIKEKESEKVKMLENDIKNHKDAINNCTDKINKQSELIGELLNKLKDIEKNNSLVTHSVQNIQTQHVNIVNNITINSYMNPNIKDILNSDLILKLIRKSGERAPLDLVANIWFNPDHPENHSIYLVNKKTNEVLIYDDKWESSNCGKVIPKIREKVYKVMNEFDLKTDGTKDKILITDVTARDLFTEFNEIDDKRIREVLITNRKVVKKPMIK